MPDVSVSGIQPLGPAVRALRTGRRWTQAELAVQLGLSQPRLSQIERGDGSFTAEQFLQILSLFNVGVEHFVRPRRRGDDDDVQSALARFGARHLVEVQERAPSSQDATGLVTAVLRAPTSPRYVTALAPVFVTSERDIAMEEVADRLARLGRERRAGWLAESVRDALRVDLPEHPKDRAATRRAALVLDLFLRTFCPPATIPPLDVFDPEIRSMKTVEQVFDGAGEVARRWGIVTKIRTEDFSTALRSAREHRESTAG